MCNSGIIDKNLLILLTPHDDSPQFVNLAESFDHQFRLSPNCVTIGLLCSLTGQDCNSIFLCLTVGEGMVAVDTFSLLSGFKLWMGASSEIFQGNSITWAQ